MRQCRKGDTSPLAYLLSLLQNDTSALSWAAANGHLEALRTLLAAGANPAVANKVREGGKG